MSWNFDEAHNDSSSQIGLNHDDQKILDSWEYW